MYLPDDATEEELAELAADQRELAMRQRERATTDLASQAAHAIRYANAAVGQHRRMQQGLPGLADLGLYDGYASDIAELNN